MAAKQRVHELAKELGTTSKTVLEMLREAGEFVKSASSTVEPPVARRLRERYEAEHKVKAADGEKGTEKKKAAGAAAKSQSKKKTAADANASAGTKKSDGANVQVGATEAEAPRGGSVQSEAGMTGAAASAAAVGAEQAQGVKGAAGSKKETVNAAEAAGAAKGSGVNAAQDATQGARVASGEGKAPKPGAPLPGPKPQAPKPGPASNSENADEAAAKPGAATPGPKPGKPRPGNSPFAPAQGMPRPGGPRPAAPRPGGPRPAAPRPGNNPFAPSQGMGKPTGGARPERVERSEKNERGPRSGAPRGGVTPKSVANHTENSSARPGSRGPRPQDTAFPGSGAPSNSGPGGKRGGFAGRGSSGVGRGATQGAFGKGGLPRGKKRKNKKNKRVEFEEQTAPQLGGVKLPHGDGTTELRLRSGASLADMADRINCNPASLVTALMALGEMATVNQSLDEDTLAALGAELGYVVKIVSPEDEDRELLDSFGLDLAEEELADEEAGKPRPPVVTVMGHVDHGKTKLLDAIRHTDVVAGEHGGITQHIGAYQVSINLNGEQRALTFIDTPGHEAFTAMRARGAEVTDIAILVVAADDGVMPQTVEAINHAQAANVPIVVAVNKVDKEGAKPDKVRGQLTEYGLVAEEYGGDVMFVDVSAKQRQGIHELLEAVLLTADAALDLKANPDGPARGVAIETKLDKGRGAIATVLVQRGTLRVGDAIVVGPAHGRVRAMLDERGRNMEEAGPSYPAAVLGLTSVPSAGDSMLVAEDERTARQIAEKRQAQQRAALLGKRRKRISLEDFNAALEQGQVETLNLIIKGDVSGTVEALEDSLLKIDVGSEVSLRIIHRGVGAITQNDINLASVDNAVVIGYNVRPAQRVAEYAEAQGVDMRFYNVIYQALDDVENAMKGLLKPIFEEKQLGTAEILQVFKSSKFGNIAGCIIRSGTIKRGTSARLVREGVVIEPNLQISSLRREKDDVTEVREGFECGIGLGHKDIKAGDIIETWEMVEIPRS